MKSADSWIRGLARVLLVLLLATAVAGCAASKSHRQGERLMNLGNYDEAVLAFARASAMKPDSLRYKISMETAKQKAAFDHFQKARHYQSSGQLELAIGELQQTTVLDPANDRARIELDKALIEWQQRRDAQAKSEIELMKERAKAERGVPTLNPASNIPIILKFKKTEVGQIYEAMSKASGINFLYDDRLDLKKEISVDLTNVSFEKAMNTLMLMNKHFYKVIDDNTLLIAEDTQQKRREIQDEVIKTFYLSNADVKDVQTLLRTLLDARKIVQNAQLNAITIRDTPNRVAIAEKIIEANDKSKAELIVDVELMQINRTVSETLGINLNAHRFSVNYQGGDAVPLNNLGLLRQLGNWAIGPIPAVTLDFLKSDSGSRVVARPQLRVTEGEKANLHIGDSVPIPTTTFSAAGVGVGGGIGTTAPITSFTYQEVGIVIEIEPRVHHNDEVSLNLNVEVSQLGDQVSTGTNTSAPSINTRQINSVIRLRDGETNLLAGLISDAGSEGRAGFPGIVDTPILQKIFASNTSTRRETDLILTLTPHIIRSPDIREKDLVPLFIGTQSNPHLRGSETSPFGPSPFRPKSDDTGLPLDEEEPAAGAEEAGEKPAEGADPETADSGEAAAAPPAARGPQPPPAAETLTAETPPPEIEEVAAETEPEDPLATRARATERGTIEEEPIKPPGAPEVIRKAPPAQPLTLAMAPARLTVAGGGGFAFNIMVAQASNVAEVSMKIKYDPAIAQFDRGLEGVLMRADGTSTRFVAQREGEGTVKIEVKRMGSKRGAWGNGSIAAVRFKPAGAGRTLLSIVDATAKDPQGNPIPVNPSGADVTVSQ